MSVEKLVRKKVFRLLPGFIVYQGLELQHHMNLLLKLGGYSATEKTAAAASISARVGRVLFPCTVTNESRLQKWNVTRLTCCAAFKISFFIKASSDENAQKSDVLRISSDF